MRYKTFIICLLLFSLAVFLRIYKIDGTFSFSAEYNYKLWPIKEIIYDDKIRLIGIEAVSYLHHIHYPPLALYIFAPILYLSQGNPLSIEIALILLSGVTAILLFLLGKETMGVNGGIIASLIYATSFFIQRNDRFIWVIGTIIFFSTLFLLTFNKMIKAKKENKALLFLVGLIVGFALNFHYQAFVLFISSLLFFFLNYSIKNASIKSLFFLVGVFIPISPLVVFELRHNFYNSQGLLLLFKDSGGILTSSFGETIKETVSAITQLPLNIIGVDSKLSSFSLIVISLLQVILVFIIYFYRKNFKKTDSKFLQLCFILWLVGIITFPLVQNKFYSVNYYLLYLIPVILFVISLLTTIKISKLRFLLFFLILLFTYINIGRNLEFKNDPSWQHQKEAVDYVLSEAPNDHFKIKFANIASEEYAFLFYYLSRKHSYPYDYIHFVEPWHLDNDTQFTLALRKRMDKAYYFGPIAVKKN